MKKFRVSLALKVYSNFEVEVNCKTEKQALDKALEMYYQGDYNEENITEPDWSNAELDIDEDNGIDNCGSGIYIEEIKEPK